MDLHVLMFLWYTIDVFLNNIYFFQGLYLHLTHSHTHMHTHVHTHTHKVKEQKTPAKTTTRDVHRCSLRCEERDTAS